MDEITDAPKGPQPTAHTTTMTTLETTGMNGSIIKGPSNSSNITTETTTADTTGSSSVSSTGFKRITSTNHRHMNETLNAFNATPPTVHFTTPTPLNTTLMNDLRSNATTETDSYSILTNSTGIITRTLTNAASIMTRARTYAASTIGSYNTKLLLLLLCPILLLPLLPILL